MTADDLNREIPMPPTAWFLDFQPSHSLAGGFGDARLHASQAALGPAFTLVSGGRIAAMWGIVSPWPGLAEGWMRGNPEVLRPIALPFTRGARTFCELVHRTLGVRRLQVHVQFSNEAFMMWARAARFTLEARLEGYLPDGEAVALMAKVWR